MTADPFIIVPGSAADRIANADDASGSLSLNYLPSERLYIVNRVHLRSGVVLPVSIPREYETLRWQGTEHEGQWFRQPSEHINLTHFELLRRPGSAVPFDNFKEWVPGVSDPGNLTGLVITYEPAITEEARQAGAREHAGWIITRDGVRAIDIEVEPQKVGLEQLADQWPLDRLRQDVVMVVGVGSIGGAVADNLAAMGIGQSLLVDPDRFLWHNVVRHVLDKGYVGRLKVDAMKHYLAQRWPAHEAVPIAADVIQMADFIRPLIDQVDLVVCAADGIAPRRVVSHLAKRARRPSVLACVLNDGGIGEVLRLRPGRRFGCLLCQHAALAEVDGIDPEADQELPYGTGLVHKPMTAIPTDLHTVGNLAAKVAVATLLEGKHGEPYALPGEHGVVGLRASQGLAAPRPQPRPPATGGLLGPQ